MSDAKSAPNRARFVAFHDLAEGQPAPAGLRFAIVIARATGGVVLVLNRWRQVWELPGGLIDPGESPRDTALRELSEEAGCQGVAPAWRGVIEVNDGRAHFGAVYECTVAQVPANFQSDETGGIALWQRGRSAPHPLGNSDAAVLNRWG